MNIKGQEILNCLILIWHKLAQEFPSKLVSIHPKLDSELRFNLGKCGGKKLLIN